MIADAKTRTHPTHHDGYRPSRAAWGVGVGLGGLFASVFLAMVDTVESSAVVRGANVFAVWAGVVAFIGGTAVAIVAEVAHRIARCPSCERWLLRRRMDYRQSYYPCSRCGVTWTCPCRKMARGS